MWYFASERLIIKAKEESFERLQKSQGKWPQSQRPQRDCVYEIVNGEVHCIAWGLNVQRSFNSIKIFIKF